jgi:3-deoxy-D-manno-octulosonate 8-phosphate phosphatase (KDO 8-P phosphatase)
MRRDQLLPFEVDEAVLARASKIKFVIFDVDGVLTDGSLFLDNHGQEYKAFNSRDGHGLKMLQRTGVQVGIITGRTSKVVEYRAADLGIKHVFQGCQDKLVVYERLAKDLGIAADAISFVGDDVVDLPIMLKVGLAVAPQDAHHFVKRHAHWVTPSRGGRGTARDLCEMLMVAQGTYVAEMNRYIPGTSRV